MITPLCKLGFKYGTDKCPQINHSYTPFYYSLFNKRKLLIKKVLEIGVGRTGASLKMWRDFFPNASIYGIDIQEKYLIQENRITTYLCDERSKDQLTQLIKKIGSDIDIIIDDAQHHTAHQEFLCRTLMPLVKKSVIYVIEDVGYSRKLTKMLYPYPCDVPFLEGRKLNEANANKLVVVHNI